MRVKQVPDQDALFRHCIFPEAFKSRGKRFAPEKVLKLGVGGGGACLVASVIWQRYQPTIRGLHRSGCKVAEMRALKGRRDSPRKLYCGAYQFYASCLSGLIGLDNVVDAYAIHDPEDGEYAHASLVLVLEGNPPISIDDTMTAIKDRLWNAMYGPVRHVCRCDRNLGSHPGKLMENAPLGPYNERRSVVRKAWNLPSAIILGFWWRTFSKAVSEREECPKRVRER